MATANELKLLDAYAQANGRPSWDSMLAEYEKDGLRDAVRYFQALDATSEIDRLVAQIDAKAAPVIEELL